ncbi:MAG: ABC transporter ATP-binding protein [Flammeovirgaceae bacterium]
MIRTSQLKYSYDKRVFFQFPDIELAQGEQGLILGKSGTGKTTFLHLLAGLRKCHQGTIIVQNISIQELESSKLDKFRAKHIGIIFQKPHFLKALTIKENLSYAQYFAGNERNEDKISEMLERLDIQQRANSKLSELSEGEKQRVSIAIALLNQPSVVLADEPTSSLDDENAEKVIKLLQEQATLQKSTLLIVTHDSRMKSFFKNHIILN